MLTAFVRHRAIQAAVGLLLGVVTLSCARTDETADQVALSAETAQGTIVDADRRTAIEVDAATRVALLNEMRTMLKAVQGIVAAAAIQDTAGIRAAALRGGMKAATETNPAVSSQLQGDFVQLGMLTHASLDIIAANVVAGNEHLILRQLATVMGNCVACHEKWRLTVRQ